jgi:hypothetical protein
MHTHRRCFHPFWNSKEQKSATSPVSALGVKIPHILDNIDTISYETLLTAGATGTESDVEAEAEVAEGRASLHLVSRLGVLQETGPHVALPEGPLLAVPYCAFHSGSITLYAFVLMSL